MENRKASPSSRQSDRGLSFGSNGRACAGAERSCAARPQSARNGGWSTSSSCSMLWPPTTVRSLVI